MAIFLEKPRYYDAPDGEEPFDKIISLSKRGFIGGLSIGIYDCMYHTDAKTALQSANCLAFWIVPMVGMSATFASVTFMATRIRKKDDTVNYGLGALACAPILHAWTKSTKISVWSTIALVSFAMLFKAKQEAGLLFWPDTRHVYGQYMYDMTIMKDVDKDWKPLYTKSTF